MAVSGVSTLTYTATNIIDEALELLGVTAEGQTPSLAAYASSFRTLNMLIKSWQAAGLNLWAVRKLYVFLEDTKEFYRIGANGDPYTTNSMIRATVDSATTTTITIDTTDEVESDAYDAMTVGDYIRVALSDNSMHQTTISDLTGGVITLADAASEAPADGTTIYVWTDLAERPMLLLEANRVTKDGDHTPLEIIARKEFMWTKDYNTTGVVNTVYYDPQNLTGILWVWPRSSYETDYLEINVQESLDTLVTAGDDIDIPNEWYLPLSLNLAKVLAPKYGIPHEDYLKISSLAQEYYDKCFDYDSELYTSVYITPDTQAWQ